MPLGAWIALVLGAAVVVALWSVSSDRRRDELARDFGKQVLLVDGVASTEGVRALFPYFVRTPQGSMVILAQNSLAAAEVAATEDMEVAVSCVLGKHRIVELPGGRWGVAVLPNALGFLGKTCEHGDHPAI